MAKYIYGIISSRPPLALNLNGLGQNPVYPISFRGIAALVSDSPGRAYPLDEEHAVGHEAVVEEVMRSRTILPFHFNSILPGEGEVMGLLQKNYQALKGQLNRLANKVEIGLRILWELPSMPPLIWPKEMGPGGRYLLSRLAEEKRNRQAMEEGEFFIRRIQMVLTPLCHEWTIQPFVTDRLLLSGAYLIDRKKADLFRAVVDRIEGKFPDLKFLVTGPWPPYNFVAWVRS